jgi:hypothetical protein
MSSQATFHKWLVIDWAGSGEAAWVRSPENAKRFLLVTPTGRKWEAEPSALSLPEREFVLIMLLTAEKPLHNGPSNEGGFDVDTLLPAHSGSLPIWCHYGGDIRLRRLEDEWRQVRLLDGPVHQLLTTLLPPHNRYPMPFSSQLDFVWRTKWKEIEDIISSYAPDQWPGLVAKLNNAWAMATDALLGDAAKVMLTAWLGARNACDRLLWRIPKDEKEATKEQLAAFLSEAWTLRFRWLAPSRSGVRRKQGASRGEPEAVSATEFSISTAFDKVRKILSILMARKNGDLDQMRSNLGSLRLALLAFQHAYDEKVELAKSEP